MSARQGLLPIAVSFGCAGTLFYYVALLIVQIANADYACESPQAVPGIEVEDLRGIGFDNSYLNLGGRCEYRMDDGSVVVTREPGWWFSETIAGFVILLAGAVVIFVRRKELPGLLYAATTLVAPPLGLALAAVAPGMTRRWPPKRAPVA